jgi:hypothetical protein
LVVRIRVKNKMVGMSFDRVSNTYSFSVALVPIGDPPGLQNARAAMRIRKADINICSPPPFGPPKNRSREHSCMIELRAAVCERNLFLATVTRLLGSVVVDTSAHAHICNIYG